jgi:hypothetical protein
VVPLVRSSGDHAHPQRRSAPPATPRSSVTVSDASGIVLPSPTHVAEPESSHADLARAHRTIAQLEAEKCELRALVNGLVRERDEQARGIPYATPPQDDWPPHAR